MKQEYLNIIKSALNNYIYLGTDSSACHKEFYADGKWKIPRSCVPHTLCNRSQLNFLDELMLHIVNSNVKGDFLEVGVWRGGACIFMRAFIKAHNLNREVWLADTFAGIPKSTNKYVYNADIVDDWNDRWVAGIDEVREHFNRYGLLDDKVHFIAGDASVTLKPPPYNKLALARLDVDSYESYMSTLSNVYPQMAEGGCIILDDWHLEPCKAAVFDFRRKNGILGDVCEIFNGKPADAHWFVNS